MGAEIGTILALSAGSAGAGIVGNILTNKTNKDIASDANALSQEQFEQSLLYNTAEREAAQQYNTSERIAAQSYNTMEREQAQAFNKSEREAAQQFQLDMWNKSNEYNDPSSQAARLRAAGINPAVINGGNTTSPISSSPASISPASINGASVGGASAGGLPHIAVPEMKNILDGRLLADNINTIIESQSKQQDVIGKSIDNETRAARNSAEIDNLIIDKQRQLSQMKLDSAQAKKIYAEIKNLKVQKFILDNNVEMGNIAIAQSAELFDATMQQMRDSHAESIARTKSIDIANALQERFGVQLSQGQINSIAAQIKSINADADLKGAQEQKVIQEKAEVIARTAGINQENKHFRIVKNLIVREMKLANRQRAADYWNPFNYVGKALGGSFGVSRSTVIK